MQTGDQCKFATIGSGGSWWPNLQLMQVVSSGGQICKFNPNQEVNFWVRCATGNVLLICRRVVEMTHLLILSAGAAAPSSISDCPHFVNFWDEADIWTKITGVSKAL